MQISRAIRLKWFSRTTNRYQVSAYAPYCGTDIDKSFTCIKEVARFPDGDKTAVVFSSRAAVDGRTTYLLTDTTLITP